jgi:hypothetical protein
VTERRVKVPIEGVSSDDDQRRKHKTTEGNGQLTFDLDGRQPRTPVLLTESQVCELLSIGRTTLRSLPLRPKHINRCVRYLASDVERYVAGLT